MQQWHYLRQCLQLDIFLLNATEWPQHHPNTEYQYRISGFSIVGNGANFTKTNITTKASHSAAYRLHEPGLNTFILIAFLLFAPQAYAQTPSGGLGAVESQYNSQLGAVMDPLVVEMCDFVTATPI